jgi:hypothetical protein
VLTKEITTCPPFVLTDNANATNPCCEHVHLVEENAKLKEQLEKGLVTCIQGEKNLNDLFSNQKEVVAKEGLGFVPKSMKKKSLSRRERVLMRRRRRRRRRTRKWVLMPRRARPPHLTNCSDPTSNGQASVYLCHPWISMLAHIVHQCIYQSAITCINNVKLIYTS